MEGQNHLPWAEVKWKLLSCVQLFATPWPYSPWNSPGQNTGVGSLSLQGIFPTQGSKSGLLRCRRILYQLSHKGSSGMLERVAYPFSSGSSHPRNQTGVSCIAGGFFTNWAVREVQVYRRYSGKDVFQVFGFKTVSLNCFTCLGFLYFIDHFPVFL